MSPVAPLRSGADLLRKSWENGTEAEATLEWSYPAYSVFTTTGSPFPSSLSTNDISDVVQIAQVTLENRPPTNSSGIMGGSSLLEDDAAGDPASLGIAVMLANVSTSNAQVNGIGYAQAATDELNYLLYNVPRVRPISFLPFSHSHVNVRVRPC